MRTLAMLLILVAIAASVAFARVDLEERVFAPLDAFEVDNGYYPKGSNGLTELIEEPKDAKNWRGPYLKQTVPNDPWGNSYVYECPGKHNEKGYDLMCMGPDGRVGGNDDITNWSEKK